MSQKFKRGTLVKSIVTKDIGLVLSFKYGYYKLLTLSNNYSPNGVRDGYPEIELVEAEGPKLDVDKLFEDYSLSIYSMMPITQYPK